MIQREEELLEELRKMKVVAQKDLEKKEGYKDYVVKNIINYNKEVELINKESGETEYFNLRVVIAEDPDTKEILKVYYLNGEETDIEDLLRKYESATPIKDVINATKENEEKPLEEQDETLTKDELEELERQKEEEKKEKKQEDLEQDSNIKKINQNGEKSLVGKKPTNIIQRINPHKTYVNELQTVSNAFNISSEVDEIAIAYPEKGDKNALSNYITMYMLDKDGRIIEESNGKRINDLFEVDDATGRNPINDDNTKMKLEGYAEQDKGGTMIRFRSKENRDLNISVEQKETMDYHEVFVGTKTRDGNDAVEVQLETDNVEIQNNLKMQQVIAYGDSNYKKEDVDAEVDEHIEKHGDDEEKIAIKNADGDKTTVAVCDSPYIPGTKMTWEELSEETGEGIIVLQERFERELADGKEPNDIVDEIEYDYGMVEHTRDRM